jgi:hypothetical protein
MLNGTLKLDTKLLKLIVESSKNLKSEKDVISAYSKLAPVLEEESVANEISENVPEELKPMANALWGLLHGSTD